MMEDINEVNEEEMDVEADQQQEEPSNAGRKVYLPGQPLNEGEELVHDDSAYVMLHDGHAGDSCLSFDIIPDGASVFQDQYPITSYFAAGTQSHSANANKLYIMKVSNLHKTLKEDDDSEDSDADSEDETKEEPIMKQSFIKHNGVINRVRVSILNEYKVYAAVWSETGKVSIYDIRPHLEHLDAGAKEPLKGKKGEKAFPVYMFDGHASEGYGIDWSSVEKGYLATGDCKKNIHIWTPSNATWEVSKKSLSGHTASVEDLQWSPNEPKVLASCSVDRSIRIWDIRQPDKSQLAVEKAHSSDVNVISWNKEVPLLVSGGDDGVINVWDLRQFKKGGAVASLKHHRGPVTTVEWCPGESSVFASGGEDNQIALWDLGVEREDENEELKELPPQLLFIHLGQTDIKELHWHRQYPGMIVSTASSGFNFFKTISV
ncbi:glutamate-rich WD repeat-containing protein 1 [Halyomorpha halys]|uniref:glutamate-rich WD repeat-containing protein 1 n=1 Tax=Halyomorpha halys TaxID=286706 RepID=UPI0006D52700|nr:glutamate-rich WD repeat-containing protein 1 [Halyomorpha halys]